MFNCVTFLLAALFVPCFIACEGESEATHAAKPDSDAQRNTVTSLSCKIASNKGSDNDDIVFYYNGRKIDAVALLSWRHEGENTEKKTYRLSDFTFYFDGHKIGRGTSAIDEFYRRLERLPIGSTVIAVDPNWKGTKYTPFTPFIPYLQNKKHRQEYSRIKAGRKLEFHAFPMTDDLRKSVYGKQGKKKRPEG